MAQYYAVERSSEYLAHYGVRGMKWGVRKALEKGNMEKLSSHYARAIIKRAKLKDHTNRKSQKEDAKALAGGGAALLGLGALGGLASYGLVKGQFALNKALDPKAKTALILHPAGLYGASGLSAIGGAAALGASAASAYRSTKRGNKRAIEKYKNFSREMDATFSKSTRKKIQKYWRQHPEEREAYLGPRRK